MTTVFFDEGLLGCKTKRGPLQAPMNMGEIGKLVLKPRPSISYFNSQPISSQSFAAPILKFSGAIFCTLQIIKIFKFSENISFNCNLLLHTLACCFKNQDFEFRFPFLDFNLNCLLSITFKKTWEKNLF